SGEKDGEQDRADERDVLRRRIHARARQQLRERRGEHEGVDHGVHSIEQPARPCGSEARDLVAIELRSYGGGRRCFWTLPSAVRGSVSIRMKARGILNDASWARHRPSSSVTLRVSSAHTYAIGTSPRASLGKPTTTASRTRGSSSSSSSISRG